MAEQTPAPAGNGLTTPAAPAAPAAPATTPAVTSAPPAATPSEAAPAPAPAGTGAEGDASRAPAPDWRDRRIAELTAKLSAARAAATPPAAPPAGDPSQQPVQVTQAEFERRVNEAAAHKAQIDRFNEECNSVAIDGQTKFGAAAFNGRVGALVGMTDRRDPQSIMAYNSFLMAAIKTGRGAELINDLGDQANLGEAHRIMSMPPVEMAVALTQRAMAMAPVANGAAPAPAAAGRRTISAAPAPVTPIGTRGGPHTPIDPTDPDRADNLSSVDWHKRRQAQKAERAGAA